MFRTRRAESEPPQSRSPGCPRTGRTSLRFLPWSDGRPDGGRATAMMSFGFVSVHVLLCVTVGIWYVLYDLHLCHWVRTINTISFLILITQ